MGSHRDFAAEIALEAGRFLKEKFYETHDITYKGEIDLVTEADRGAEALLIARIENAFPGHGIMAEETRGSALTKEHLGSSTRWTGRQTTPTSTPCSAYPSPCSVMGKSSSGRSATP